MIQNTFQNSRIINPMTQIRHVTKTQTHTLSLWLSVCGTSSHQNQLCSTGMRLSDTQITRMSYVSFYIKKNEDPGVTF